MKPDDGSGTRVGQGTWFQYSVVVLLVGAAISCTTFFVSTGKDLASAVSLLGSLNTSMTVLTSRVDAVERAVSAQQAVNADRWTGTDHRIWSSELARRNPALIVPDVPHDSGNYK